MTKKDKQLLLKDLCARLPYGVKAFAKTHKGNKIGKVITITTKFIDYSKGKVTLGELYADDECFWLDYGLFKPYLRSMLNMTRKEADEYKLFSQFSEPADVVDWLNKNMFDHRGLIPMGLALEATEGMYNIK